MAIGLPKDMEAGSLHKTNSSGVIKVIECINSYEIRVVFIDTGNEVIASAGNIRKGSVKDRMRPSVYGVGFIGDGNFRAAKNGNRCEEYVAWSNMMTRCYSDSYQAKIPAYKGCTVCKEWHNYQNFAEWASIRKSLSGSGWQVDKDLLVPGNKEYSPDSCVIIPQWLNTFLASRDACRGEFPVGVSKRKGKDDFESYCNFDGKRIHLGVFSNPEAAHSAWMEKKLSIALSKKNEMDAIDERIYQNVVSIIKGMK